MLLSLQNVQSLVTTVLLLCAYGFSATLTEAGQALVARKMGDDTAANEGWLSLNPLDHMDFVGTLLVFVFGFSWIRFVPMKMHVEPQGSFFVRLADFLKWLFVYCTQGLVALGIAFLSLTALVWSFGQKSIPIAFSMFFSACAPLSDMTQLYPTRSSLAIIGALCLISLIVYNIFIASISLISNTFYYILARYQGSAFSITPQSGLVVWGIAFLCVILFANYLQVFLLATVTKSALLIGWLLGAF